MKPGAPETYSAGIMSLLTIPAFVCYIPYVKEAILKEQEHEKQGETGENKAFEFQAKKQQHVKRYKKMK